MSSASIAITTTPLGISATFTGAYESPPNPPTFPDGGQYVWIVILACADQSGTIKIEQSDDEINIIRSDSLATAADSSSTYGNSALLKVQIVATYVRVVYTNGAVAQTEFALDKRYSMS